MDNLFPIGTAVTLKNNDNTVDAMIIGFFPEDNESNAKYDYLGIAYPLGMGLGNTIFPFNSSHINKVISRGYENDACREWLEALKQVNEWE